MSISCYKHEPTNVMFFRDERQPTKLALVSLDLVKDCASQGVESAFVAAQYVLDEDSNNVRVDPHGEITWRGGETAPITVNFNDLTPCDIHGEAINFTGETDASTR